MIKQETLDINLIKSEPIDGNFNTSDIVSEFLESTVPSSTSGTEHEPMEQDVPATTGLLVTQAATAASWTTTGPVSVATLQAPVRAANSVAPLVRAVAPNQVNPARSQQINVQANKMISTPVSTPGSGSKTLLISAPSSSPNKVIAIPGNMPRVLQGLGSLPRIQLLPGQPKLATQSTLKPIAPRFPASTTPVSRSQIAAPQIQIISSGTRDATQGASTTSQTSTSGAQQPHLLVQTAGRPGVAQLRAIAPNIGGMPRGTTIQFPVGTIIKDGIVYVPQPVQQGTGSGGHPLSPAVQITPAVSSIAQPVNGVQEPLSPTRQRKPCNCTKSQCLKLYCDCFANGEFCNNCNCNNCSNNIEHESERSKAIRACLDRNPNAFHPKIGKGKGETERRHNKGCHCKRSGCLKNYCECYEAKILCTNLCKCTGCKNFEESPERKTLMHLADAAEVRVQQQNAAKTKLESQMEDLPSRTLIQTHAGEKLPFSFVTSEVVEATCRCLLLQASEAEKNRLSHTETQKLILEEFGNCLLKIIHTASNRSAS